MNAGDAVFIGIGVVCALSALYAVTTRYLLRSIIALGAFLTALSAEYYALGADYVAVIQIFVYVGGVVVLLLFALMLSASGERHPVIPTHGRAVGAALAYGLGGLMIWAAWGTPLGALRPAPDNTTELLGEAFLNRQLYLFELIGVVLLAALVTALVMVRGERQ